MYTALLNILAELTGRTIAIYRRALCKTLLRSLRDALTKK